MSRVELSAIGGATLLRADLGLDAGLHTVVLLTPEGGDELVRIVSGNLQATRGVVLVQGANPYTSPEVRRQIGSLFAVEDVSELRTVERALAQALLMQGSSKSPASVLEPFGLSGMARRSPSSLSQAETRGVALALALAVDGGVLALFEPLATSIGRARVVAAISAAAQGSCVLVVTASARDAADLGGKTYPLRFGRVGGETPLLSLRGSDASALEMVVRTNDPRRLVSSLALDPALFAVESNLGVAPGEIIVSGADPDAVALAVLRSAQRSGADILALFQRPHAGGGLPPGARRIA